jgi:mannose-6-phosphate isomerase-like protein (cupin superfamily)
VPDRSLYRLGPVANGFTIKHLGDFETNGRWSLVRKGLDVSCFGMNVVEIEQGYSIPEHNELERDQEEVFIVLDGDAVMVIDGEDHPAPAGTFTRVAPSLQRTVRNDNEKPVRLLIVSAPTTSGYQDMGWA